VVDTRYSFDWRAQARLDGWHLSDDAEWHHVFSDQRYPDDHYVYLGSSTWAETWSHAPNRPPDRERDTAFDVP